MKKFELVQYPNGRWGVILTGITSIGGYVDTTFENTIDEALDWIKERA